MENKNSQLQEMLKDMLVWFHTFCTENNLCYYVIGGTMLGAVRHHGFIPWDDDIDIGMPRKDYRCLAELMGNEHNQRYVLETPYSDNKDFFYTMSKLYDTKTTLVENTRYKIKRGIYLDIFPLDGMGKTKEEAKNFFSDIKRRRLFLLTLTTGIRKGRGKCKNAAVLFLRIIPDFILNKKKMLHDLEQRCAEKDYDDCAFVGVLMGNWLEKEIMPKCYFGTPTKYQFGTSTVMGVEKYDEYLTALYGNWRQLPPEDKRQSHHDFLYMDLEHSYLG